MVEIGPGGDLNAAFMDLVDLSGIEALDLDNGAANALELTIADLLLLSGDQDVSLDALLGADIGQSLTIYGDGLDSVTLASDAGGQFSATGQVVGDPDGSALAIYQYSTGGGDILHTLAIDADVAVTLQPAA